MIDSALQSESLRSQVDQAITTHELVKKYENRRVVDGFDIRRVAGAGGGFMGPRGAGQ